MTQTETRPRRILPAGTGVMLREARHRSGQSAREAAQCAGIGMPYLRDIESGRRCPSTAVAQALADVLELTASERADLAAVAVPDVGYSRPGRVRTLRPTAAKQ